MANEKRLIDLQTAIKRLRGECIAKYPFSYYFGLLAAADEMAKTPTVDAVEVVRCKDCVNYCGFERCKNGICDVDSVSKRAVNPDDFCSYGERKDNGEG